MEFLKKPKVSKRQMLEPAPASIRKQNSKRETAVHDQHITPPAIAVPYKETLSLRQRSIPDKLIIFKNGISPEPMKLKPTRNKNTSKITKIVHKEISNTYLSNLIPRPDKIPELDKQPHIENTTVKRVIPLKIFQTWYTLNLPPKMKKNVKRLQRENPEFEYFLFDDKMCRKFIQEHFDEDVVFAFDKLKPGAYKADLWRYCVLYIHGGIYLDIKMGCVNGFKLTQLTDKEYWVKDCSPAGIYQAVMVCLPNNHCLYKAIQKIVENC